MFAARHLVQVLRAKVAEKAILFNGDGYDYEVEIQSIIKHDVSVLVLAKNKNINESSLCIHLYQALSTNDKMDWVIQKAVELGVQKITPLLTQRSQVKLKHEKKDKKIHHWQQIAIAACEQSGRSVIPQIYSITTIEHCLQEMSPIDKHERRFVLNPYGKQGLTFEGVNQNPGEVKLFIGPEGGFTEDEISFIQSQAFESLVLGPRILRTETAPIAGVAILQYIFGDFV